MARKRMPPFVERALNLLKFSILMAKLGKPIIPRLVFLKKSRKIKKLRHYNHGFIQEYEFSPSSTPLFHHYKSPFKKRSRHDVYEMLATCRCWGSFRVEGGVLDEETEVHYALEAALPCVVDDGRMKDLQLEIFDSKDEEYSVDQRAEMFIQRFYEDMRIQKQEAVLELEGNPCV